MNAWVEEPDVDGVCPTPVLAEDRNLGMAAQNTHDDPSPGMGRIVVVLNASDGLKSSERELGLKEYEKAVFLDWEQPVVNWAQFHALTKVYVDALDSVESELGGLFRSGGYLYEEVVLEPLNHADPKVRFANHVLALALATASCAYSEKPRPAWPAFLERTIDDALEMRWMMPATTQTHEFIKNVGRPVRVLVPDHGDVRRWRGVLQKKEKRLFLRVHEQRCTCGSCLDIGVRSLLTGGCMSENFVYDTTSEGGAFADAVGGRADLDELDKHAVASKLFLIYACEPFRKYLLDEAQKTLDNQAAAAQLNKWRAKTQAAFGGIGTFFGGLFPAVYGLIIKAEKTEDVLLAPILAIIQSAVSTYESRCRLYRLVDAEYQVAMQEIQRGRELVSAEMEVPKAARLSLPASDGGTETPDEAAVREVQEFKHQARRKLGTLARLAKKPLAIEESRALMYEDLPVPKLKEWAQGFRRYYQGQLDVRRRIGFWEDHLAALPPLEVSPTYPAFTPSANSPLPMFADCTDVRMGVDDLGNVLRSRVSSKSVATALRRHYWDRNLWGMPSDHFRTIQRARKCLGPLGLDCSGARPCVYGFCCWHNTLHPNIAVVIGAEALQDTLGYDVIGASIGVHPNSLQLTRIGVMAGENYRWLAVSDEGAVGTLRTMSSGMPASTGRNLFRCIL